MPTYDYDVLVVGAGQGGLPAAHMAANLGAKVALIEEREVGGTWVNEGCVPTKALLRSAEVMHLVARRAAEFGVEIERDVRFHLDQAVARKDSIVKGIHKSIYGALDRRKEAIEFLRGKARFLNEHEVDTGDSRLSFDKAIVATGARRVVPPIPGLDEVEFLTNQTALELSDLPSSMIIVGGGYVGIEFAQMYGRFGTRVTLLGRNSRLAPTEDTDLAERLAGYLREEDIEVYTNAPVTSLRKEGLESVASATVDGEEKEFRAEVVLLAAGRVGNTDRLGLEASGVATPAKGFIQVDDQLTTSQPNIFAIGDVKGGWMFTHVATYDGPIAALNAVQGTGRSVDYRVVPRVIFTDPALAAVGLTEAEAREQGYDVAVGSVPVQGARSSAIGDLRGRLKAVVNQADGEILGFHILAPHGDDLLHEVVAAMHDHGHIERIGKSIHAHPTLSEMVKAAAKAAK